MSGQRGGVPQIRHPAQPRHALSMQRGDFVGGDSRRSGVADVEVTLEVELLSAFSTRYQGRPLTRSFVFIYDCLLVEYPVHNVGRPLPLARLFAQLFLSLDSSGIEACHHQYQRLTAHTASVPTVIKPSSRANETSEREDPGGSAC